MTPITRQTPPMILETSFTYTSQDKISRIFENKVSAAQNSQILQLTVLREDPRSLAVGPIFLDVLRKKGIIKMDACLTGDQSTESLNRGRPLFQDIHSVSSQATTHSDPALNADQRRETYKAGRKKYYEKNKEKRKAAALKYYENNKERYKTYKADYYEKNKERIKAASATYRARNQERRNTQKASIVTEETANPTILAIRALSSPLARNANFNKETT